MHKKDTYTWIYNSYEELNIETLYKIMCLRSEVFVVEQHCHYLDLDNKDQKALHLQCYDNEELIAYCRVFKKGHYFDLASIGRVVVSTKYRGLSLGHVLMNKAIELIKDIFDEKEIMISAQLYLKDFYEKHGFIQISDEYLDADIIHIQMKKH